jgi:NADP-reducing hydrogenase subunit HndB
MKKTEKIDTAEQLTEIKRKNEERIAIRALKKPSENVSEITIGTATCGIAAGAKETADAIREELKQQGMDNVKVVEVGCIGYCYHEPIVQVSLPGEVSVYYGKVDVQKGRDIVRKHIKSGEYLNGSIINLSFEEA